MVSPLIITPPIHVQYHIISVHYYSMFGVSKIYDQIDSRRLAKTFQRFLFQINAVFINFLRKTLISFQ